jgi:hypothetical protein
MNRPGRSIPCNGNGNFNAARSAQLVLETAQKWAALMQDEGFLETIMNSHTEAGKVTLLLLDCVNDYEYRSAGAVAICEQGPVALW